MHVVVVIVIVIVVVVVIIAGIGIPPANGEDGLLSLVGFDLGVGWHAVDDFEAVVSSVDFWNAALSDVDDSPGVATIGYVVVVGSAGRRRRRR